MEYLMSLMYLTVSEEAIHKNISILVSLGDESI